MSGNKLGSVAFPPREESGAELCEGGPTTTLMILFFPVPLGVGHSLKSHEFPDRAEELVGKEARCEASRFRKKKEHFGAQSGKPFALHGRDLVPIQERIRQAQHPRHQE